MRLIALALRRVIWMPPTLLGLTLVVFAVSHIIPADPARVMAGENASPEQVEALRQKFGLDQPLPLQFVRYLHDLASGDMGISLYSHWRPSSWPSCWACRLASCPRSIATRSSIRRFGW
jgi:peptide/nickel transport system permease protein